jgi:hypothetical protein
MALSLLPSIVAAAPSARTTAHQIVVDCDLHASDEASARLVVSIDDTDSVADLRVWIEPASPLSDPPTLVTSSSSVEVTDDGSSVGGVIDLIELDGDEPAGTATFDVRLTPVGPAQTIQRSADGNHKQRVTETVQPLSVIGSLMVPGDFALALDGCSGTSVTFETFENNPASNVSSGQFTSLLCQWFVGDTFVGLAGEADRELSYLDIAVATPDGGLGGADDLTTLSHTRIAAAFELQPTDGQGIAAHGGVAYANAVVSRGERATWDEIVGDTHLRVVDQELLVNGTLAILLDDGTQLDLAMTPESCRMSQHRERIIDGGRE